MGEILGPYQKRDHLEAEGFMGCETVVMESDSDDAGEPENSKKQIRKMAAIENIKAAFEYIYDSVCEF